MRSEHDSLMELGRLVAAQNAERQRVADEYAAKWTAEKRRQALKDGDALPGPGGVGRFPIKDQEDMTNAAGLLGNSSVPKATVIAHMKKQAKKHKLTLPMTLQATSA